MGKLKNRADLLDGKSSDGPGAATTRTRDAVQAYEGRRGQFRNSWRLLATVWPWEPPPS